ncbi:MAG: nitroreductase family protein [Oscillospiraceae bacterium]|nr:nitroreductase family protein [Oscillospiraceae bacterium]
MDAIFQRKSYRGAYLPDPVPRADLTTLLEAGLSAPSGCNKQTTSLIAVDDPALLREIFAIMDLPDCKSAPAVICVLSKHIAAYRDGWGKERCYSVQDYAAAIENILLEAVQLGYQSCWIEGHVTDADEQGKRIAEMLAVPEYYELVAVLPIGRAAEPLQSVQKRPFSERAWFNRFGQE